MRANLPDSNYFIGKFVPGREDVQIVALKDSGNDGHVFRGHSQSLARDVACKIIPKKNLQHAIDGKEIWKAEVHRADVLKNSSVVKFEGLHSWVDEGARIDCVVLLSEFVEGISLRDFTKKHKDEISVPFIRDWLSAMLNLFNEMQIRNVVHGDLHPGNILVEDRSSYDLMGSPFFFRVTDFGVAEATSHARFKDDYHQLADVLASLLRVIKYQYCSPKDKFIFNVLRNDFLGRHLVESDPTIDTIARQPRELLQKLVALDVAFENMALQESARLLTPFDFLSCEQIGDASAMLRALYSDRFLGLSEIESKNNVVVTGPRGCGKSTVFRSLSLEQKMRVNEADPQSIGYIGVYYRCDDLYFAFPRYTLPNREEAWDVPIHFVTSTLLAKLCDVVENWAKQYFPDEFKGSEVNAVKAFWGLIGVDPPDTPNANTLKAVVSCLNSQRLKAMERHRFANDDKRVIGRSFGPEIIQKACEIFSVSFSFLRERPVYFFVDDYSSPKVSKILQQNLNRIFMQRTSGCFFKLSTESPVSFVRSDLDDKTYVESREFVLHNLGLVYLHASAEPKLAFIEDVFRRRFNNSSENFPARELVELVGSNEKQNNNELAKSLRRGEKPPQWGKEVLSKLCSGDIHYLISLVGDMVRRSGGTEHLKAVAAVPKISAANQNQAIREAAGSFLKNLRSIPRCGERLVSVVEAFGNVAHSHLRFIDSKNDAGLPPKQAARIEPYEAFDLSEDAQQLYDELLRYSVFIEDFRGKSRRGNVVPRLYLRRFLIPHFNLTFSNRDSIEIEPADFEAFLREPKKFEKKLRIKSAADAARMAKRADRNEEQLRLGIVEEST